MLSTLTNREKIIKARISLQQKSPFFSYISMHLNIVENNNMPYKSMGVDEYGNLYYDKDFVKSISDEHMKSVLCHEILHIVLEHTKRTGNRNFKIANVAKDIVINNMLTNEGFSLPSTGILPRMNEFTIPNTGYVIKDIDKKVWEEIYDEICKFLKKNKAKNLKGVNPDDSIVYDKCKCGKADAKDKSHKCEAKSEIQKISKGDLKKKWKNIILEAASIQRMRGDATAGMKLIIDKILDSKLDWRSILYKYITSEIPYDYSYSRPSKKSIITGIYMPHIKREHIDICVSVDTSASIKGNELNQFMSEIVSIAKSSPSINMTVIICDSEIKNVYELNNGNIQKVMNLKIEGGGGTSHIPVYKWIKENKPNARLLIAFTDGYTDYPETEEVNTLWVLTTKRGMKWGNKVYI